MVRGSPKRVTPSFGGSRLRPLVQTPLTSLCSATERIRISCGNSYVRYPCGNRLRPSELQYLPVFACKNREAILNRFCRRQRRPVTRQAEACRFCYPNAPFVLPKLLPKLPYFREPVLPGTIAIVGFTAFLVSPTEYCFVTFCYV